MSKKLNIGIVGAGIQGVSNALFLQKKGFEVTIFDRDNPGSPAASYGNAGHFSPYASLSLNRTDVLADVPLVNPKTSATSPSIVIVTVAPFHPSPQLSWPLRV